MGLSRTALFGPAHFTIGNQSESFKAITSRDAATRAIPSSKDFAWDGVSEDDRPATAEYLQAGVAAKEQVAIRFDHDVLTAFRTAGPGWQTRMNDALKD